MWINFGGRTDALFKRSFLSKHFIQTQTGETNHETFHTLVRHSRKRKQYHLGGLLLQSLWYVTGTRDGIELWPSGSTLNFLFDFLIAHRLAAGAVQLERTRPSIFISRPQRSGRRERERERLLFRFERKPYTRGCVEIKGTREHLFAGEKLTLLAVPDFWIHRTTKRER